MGGWMGGWVGGWMGQFYSISSGSKVIVNFVFELRSELGNICMKGIKIISVCQSEDMVHFVQEKVRNKLGISRASSYSCLLTYSYTANQT